MPKMIGYLGGDSNTLVSRRAEENDVRVAVEYVDDNRMLVVCVMQTGEVMVQFTTVRQDNNTDTKVNEMYVVGKIERSTEGELYYLSADTAPPETLLDKPILTVVPDTPQDSDDYEPF